MSLSLSLSPREEVHGCDEHGVLPLLKLGAGVGVLTDRPGYAGSTLHLGGPRTVQPK